MTTLTPQQRIQAYEYALNKQQEYDNDFLEDGVCYDLQFHLNEDVAICEIHNYFPEFLAQKPKNMPGIGGFWFTTRAERIAALEAAIELTKKSLL